MAQLTCHFFSEVLAVGTSVTVILPQQTEAQVGVPRAADAGRSAAGGGDCPVLYLLHGLSDDHTSWVRNTSIERYAVAAGLAVVMPAVHRSFYADEVHGHRYWTFVADELPSVVRSFLRVSDRPEATFVAGLSMGGYGALKLALTYPDRFAAAASLSGALDVRELAAQPDRAPLFEQVFGGRPGPEVDLFALLRGVVPAAVPALHLSCGTEDELYAANLRFVAAAARAGLAPVTDFRPGDHEWGLWDTVIREVIDWLPLPAHPPDPAQSQR